MPAPGDDTPAYLLEPPDGQPPAPPVLSAEPLLPLHELTWENFERLCGRIVKLEEPECHAQPFGTKGQEQSGIDIYRRLHDGLYATYQCRKVTTMTDGKIKKAVDDFLDGEWAGTTTSFVLCTSHSTVRTERAREVERQVKRLNARTPPIGFDVWDAEVLSVKLKDLPDLVLEFFGRPWLDRFVPQHAAAEISNQLAELKEMVSAVARPTERVRVVTLDWAPERLQRALKALHEDEPERFERLTECVSTPPESEPLVELIARPPGWARDGDGSFWELVARMAESIGYWSASADAWEQAASRRDPDDAVRSLMSAAASAAVDQDTARRDALVARASEMDPNHPRVLLERLEDEDSPPRDQLEDLERLRAVAEHNDDRLLIAARMALARLVLPDVDGARGLLPEIDERGAGSAIARAVRLNVTIQQARLDTLSTSPLDAPALKDARRGAAELRDRLVAERRWEESARVLMLAADALSLLGERKEAADLLRGARPEELASPTGAVVLADAAASRALDFRLALEFLRGAADGPGVRRIRAEALEAVGTPQERQQALVELDAIAAEGGPEAPEAAFVRLAATLGDRHVPWSQPAADFLAANGHERAAITAHAFYLARWEAGFERADALLVPHEHQPWAKVVRLRLAMSRGAHTPIREAADDVLSIGPGQGPRVEAARGYAMVGDYARAKEVLMGVARDPSAPATVQGEAYGLLMRVVGPELDDWRTAATLYDEWEKLQPTNPGVSSWAPVIANRRPK